MGGSHASFCNMPRIYRRLGSARGCFAAAWRTNRLLSLPATYGLR